MRTKQNVLMLSLLVSSVGIFLNASDDCHTITVDVCGQSRKVDCRTVGTGLDAIARYVGLPNLGDVDLNVNGQCIPLEMMCRVKVALCDRISISK